MGKGVVFSVGNGTAIVLEEGGQFRKLPAGRNWKKGDVVKLPGAGRSSVRRFSALRHVTEVAVGVMLIISLVSYACYHYLGKTTTYISLDINPSIELGLNNIDRVISATSYNAEGLMALDEVDVNGMTVGEAIWALVSTEVLKPLLEGNLIVVAVSSDSDRPDLDNAVENAVYDSVTANGAGDYMISDTDWELTEQAQELGVSLGTLTLAKQVQEKDPDADLEALLELTTQELLALLDERGPAGAK